MSLALSEEQELLRNTAREFVARALAGEGAAPAARRAGPGRLLARRSGSRWRSSAGPASSCPRSSAARISATRSSASCSRSAAARSRPRRSSRRRCSAGTRSCSAATSTQKKEILLGASRRASASSRSRCRRARTTRPTRSRPAPRRPRTAIASPARRRSCSTATSPTSSIVVARTAGKPGERDGLSLFLVPKGARGLGVERTIMVDGRNAANVTLDGVEVDRSALVGHAGRGADVLDPVLDRATIGARRRDARHARPRPSSARSRT